MTIKWTHTTENTAIYYYIIIIIYINRISCSTSDACPELIVICNCHRLLRKNNVKCRVTRGAFHKYFVPSQPKLKTSDMNKTKDIDLSKAKK